MFQIIVGTFEIEAKTILVWTAVCSYPVTWELHTKKKQQQQQKQTNKQNKNVEALEKF